MDCAKIKEQIPQYIENTLSDNDSKMLSNHMERCGSCRLELDEMLEVIELCKNIPELNLPDNFKTELHTKLLEEKENLDGKRRTAVIRNRYLKIFSAMAAGFLIIFFVRGLFGGKLADGRNFTSSTAPSSQSADIHFNEKASGPSNAIGTTAGQADASGVQQKGYNTFTGDTSVPQAENKALADTAADAGAKDKTPSTPSVKADDNAASYIVGNSADIKAEFGSARSGSTYEFAVTNKNVNIEIASESPDKLLGKIQEIARSYGSVTNDQAAASVTLTFDKPVVTATTTNGSSNDVTDMAISYKVPNVQFTKFTEALKESFAAENVTIETPSITDVTGKVKELEDKTAQLSDKLELLKASNSEKTDEMDQLAKERDAVQKELDTLREDAKYTFVSLIIKKK